MNVKENIEGKFNLKILTHNGIVTFEVVTFKKFKKTNELFEMFQKNVYEHVQSKNIFSCLVFLSHFLESMSKHSRIKMHLLDKYYIKTY